MRTLGVVVVFWLAIAAAGAGRDIEVPFETGPQESVIVVRGTANGRPAVFILDTGSSRTILRPELVGTAAGSLPTSAFADGGPGLHAQGRWTRATIRLGEKTWRREVVAMNFDEVSRALGMRVDGLIGQDLLREFDRVTIDFRARKILLTGKGDGSP
jgi:hypothetical protein